MDINHFLAVWKDASREFDSFRCGSLLSQGLLIRIFYKSSLIFFSRVKEEF